MLVNGNDGEENENIQFSPVPVPTVIKIIMCLAKRRGWHARYFDFQNAFSNGKQHLSVYVEMPGYLHGDDMRAQNVLKLWRSLYGLRDAARIWYELMTSEFNAFRPSQWDAAQCIFHGKCKIVVCYVTYIFMFIKNEAVGDEIKKFLARTFCGEGRRYTTTICKGTYGLVCRKHDHIAPTSPCWIVIIKGNMVLCKPVKSPMSTKIGTKQWTYATNLAKLRRKGSIIGSILYPAMNTCPDIAVAASM